MFYSSPFSNESLKLISISLYCIWQIQYFRDYGLYEQIECYYFSHSIIAAAPLRQHGSADDMCDV